jgi:hypothetical protein
MCINLTYIMWQVHTSTIMYFRLLRSFKYCVTCQWLCNLLPGRLFRHCGKMKVFLVIRFVMTKSTATLLKVGPKHENIICVS